MGSKESVSLLGSVGQSQQGGAGVENGPGEVSSLPNTLRWELRAAWHGKVGPGSPLCAQRLGVWLKVRHPCRGPLDSSQALWLPGSPQPSLPRHLPCRPWGSQWLLTPCLPALMAL